MSLVKHTGHLVEARPFTKDKPIVPGWYWWRAESFYVGVRCVEIMKNSPQVLSAGLQTQDLRVSGDDAFLKGLPLDGIPGEWCPIPLPTDATAQGWYKAEEVEAMLVKRSAKKVMYPIMQGPSVPWEVMAPHESMAQSNHGGQSLARLAERGGLSPGEAWCVVNGIRLNGTSLHQWDLWSKSWCEYAERINLHYDKADEAEELLGEVYSTLETLVVLVPDIGSLSKVKWLIDRLRGGV